ncbi:hypothetical protein ACHAW5_010160 [Stephanodiscus triporus]|uniref:Uncharacterized protein n=1 Tax=Stephanodiscus triporus TaxID=2934178 RepID=A0ABD3NM93_9STRA
MASLFSLEEATEELRLGAFSAPVIQAAEIAAALYYRMRERSRVSGRTAQPRQRAFQVTEVLDVMGPQIFRRAFRMSWDGFWHLHSILFPHISSAIDESSGYKRKGGRDGGGYLLPPIPNGPITTSIRLGAALCYFAETLEEQRKIAAGFEAVSTPGIELCGAIDGILIWIKNQA